MKERRRFLTYVILLAMFLGSVASHGSVAATDAPSPAPTSNSKATAKPNGGDEDSSPDSNEQSIEQEVEPEPSAKQLAENFFENIPECIDTTNAGKVLSQGCEMLKSAVPDAVCGLLAEKFSGQTIFEHNADRLFVPASNTKIITSAAALHYLGPAFKFHTDFYTMPNQLKNSVLNGYLYIKGGGDPLLTYEKMWRIARVLKQRGIKEIRRGLAIDTSLFADMKGIPGSDFETNDRSYRAIPSAFSASFNSFEIYVRPTKRGQPAYVSVEPSIKGFFKIKSKVRTSSRLSSARIRIDTRPLKGGRILVKVWGRIPENASTRLYYRRVPVPWRYAAEVFRFALKHAGIKVGKRVLKRQVPAEAELFYSHESMPLGQMLWYVNKNSSNFITEQLLLTMTAELDGAPADFTKASKLLHKFLAEIGAHDQDIVIENGCGLTLHNKLSPRTVVYVLRYMMNDPATGPEFVSSLSIAGRDGTLENRMPMMEDSTILRAKTGTLEDALALSGIISTDEVGNILFSSFVNGCPKSDRSLCTAFLDWQATALSKFQNSCSAN